MILPIYIDTSAISDQYASLDKQAIDSICDNIAKTLAVEYANQLKDEADKSLHQTKKRYKDAISVSDSGKMEGTVILDFSQDPLIRMIEEGASAWDMKESMLNSPKAKVGKNGNKYITVPFRIGTPNIVAESDVFSSIMPAEVYQVAKQLQAPKGGNSDPLLVQNLPSQYQAPATRAVIQDSAGKVLFNEYTHKSSIFAGIVKSKDAKTGQNRYDTFRRISENSDDNSWINKGIEAHNLVGLALSNFNQDEEVQTALEREFNKLGL